MPIYSSTVISLPYPPHRPCREHDDCRENAEMAEACGMTTEPKPYEWTRESGPVVFVFRKVETSRYYTPGETTPRDSSVNERDVTVERRNGEPNGQIIYVHTSHTEHHIHESYVGSVVRLWSDPNARIMSDVWGTVHYADVIAANGELITFSVGNCEFGGADTGGLENVVDVTPEAWERNRLFLLRQSIALETEAAERAARKIAADKIQAARDAVAPRKGARVKVIGARGKGAPPKGSIGECFWVGEVSNRATRYSTPP